MAFESVCYHPLFLFNLTGTAWQRSCVRALCTAPKMDDAVAEIDVNR